MSRRSQLPCPCPYSDGRDASSSSDNSQESQMSISPTDTLIPCNIAGRRPIRLGRNQLQANRFLADSDDDSSSQDTIPLHDGNEEEANDEEEEDQVEEEDEDEDEEFNAGSWEQEPWDLVDEAYQRPAPTHQTRQDGYSSHPTMTTSPNAEASTTEPIFTFDDEDAVEFSSDSELDWANQPFDYTVPFDRPILQERYSFETSYPRAAPIIRRAMSVNMTSGQEASRTISDHRRSLIAAYHNTADQVDQAMHTGRIFASNAYRIGSRIAGEVSRISQEVTEIVGMHWVRLPTYVDAMGRRWRGVFEGGQSRRPVSQPIPDGRRGTWDRQRRRSW